MGTYPLAAYVRDPTGMGPEAERRWLAMSTTMILVLFTIGWLLLQYAIPGAVSYYLIHRDEMKSAGGARPVVQTRHVPHGV